MSSRVELELRGISLTTERLESTLLENQNQVKSINDATFHQGQALQYLVGLSNRRIGHLPFVPKSDAKKAGGRSSSPASGISRHEEQMSTSHNAYRSFSNTNLRNEDPSCCLPSKGFKEPAATLLQLHFQTLRRCTSSCCCSCHEQHQLQSPQALDRILGSLLIGYVGLPRLPRSLRKGNTHDCEMCRGTVIHIRYTFPYWMLQRAIHTSISISHPRGPELLLRCFRVCSDQSPFFRAIFLGDLELVKTLLRRREGSALDVDIFGFSALHVSIKPTNKASNAKFSRLH